MRLSQVFSPPRVVPSQHWFVILLVLLLAYIVLSPLLDGSEYRLLDRATLNSFILLAAIFCLRFGGLGLATARGLGLLALASGWVTLVAHGPAMGIVSAVVRMVFFAVVVTTLIYQIAASRKVTLDVIVGAIDGYLLLGFMGAMAFTVLELHSPGSLRAGVGSLAGTDFIYFSFITMATVGYGDIVPAAPLARSAVVLLAVTGQLYVAILISLLVGKYLGRGPAAPAA
jgi:small-conductance mechanosensitive channel